MSELKAAMKRQIDHSGVLLLKIASSLSDEEFFYKPESGGSMAWTLGHLAALQDWAINRVFQGTAPRLERDAREALKGGRAILEEDHQYFENRASVTELFASTQSETLKVLHNYDEAKWNGSTPSGCRFPTYGALWEHLALHNSWHLGAISVTLPRVARLALSAPRFYSVDPEDER